MSNPCDPLDYTRQAPLSIAFYRQGYWCGLPFPSPGDLSNPGNEPQSPALQADDAGMMLLALPIPGPPCPDLLEETSGGEVFNQCFHQLTCMCMHIRSYRNKEEKKVKSLSHVWLFATLWTVALQAPPSMGFSRQEYWSGFPLPSPGDLLNPGIDPRSPALQANALPSEPPGKPIGIKICA